MISFFRRFFNSKFGVPVTLAFLGVIAIAFASADITGSTFGGVSGGDRVAVVGDKKIGTAELRDAAQEALRRERERNPTISMPAFIEQGGLEDVMDMLVDRAVLAEYARMHGLRASENLINSEILDRSEFRGPDGTFSRDVYLAVIGRQGFTDQQFRENLEQVLLAQQLLQPATFGSSVPDKLAARYLAAEKERRIGSIGIIPSSVFAPTGDPTNAQLSKYYQDNRGDFIRPERRTIRYATFDPSAAAESAEPTEQEIAARYERDAEQYAASENRTLSQLIVPTQQAANAIREQVSSGTSLAQAARGAGLTVASIGPISREDYASQTSSAVAQAVFSTAEGQVAAPTRSGLGWHVVRVNDVNSVAARSLAQVRGEIEETLRAEKLRAAIADLSSMVEDQLSSGVSLSEVAESLELELQTTRPLLANGQVYGTSERGPAVLGPALETAFQMDEGEPQIAEIVPGQLFLIFEASRINESAAAPLKEIRDDVVASWRRAQGLAEARKVADKVIARLGKGEALAAAMRAENSRLTDIDRVDFTREQLRATGQQIPPPLALLFSMAEGSTKKLEGPADVGYFVVDLDDIQPGEIDDDDPQLAAAKSELGQVVGIEYFQQLLESMRETVGVERNETAIEAVRKQLVGET